MDKLQKKIREIEEEHAEETLSAHLETHQQQNFAKALMMLGGINVASKISQALGAESMRALIRFQEERHYELLGFENFVDFLTNSDYSPMSKNQFYDRKAILEKEGDQTFDLLNSLSLSINKRKLLGAGNVQLDGDKVIVVTTNPDGEEQTQEIEISDRTRLLQTLSALADQAALLNQKNTRQREKIEKGESEIESLQKKLDSGIYGTNNVEAQELDCFMRINTSFKMLIELANKTLTLVQKEKNSEFYLTEIFASFRNLQSAYGRNDLNFSAGDSAQRKPLAEMEENEFHKHVAKKMKGYTGDNEFASITSDLNDEELEELMD